MTLNLRLLLGLTSLALALKLSHLSASAPSGTFEFNLVSVGRSCNMVINVPSLDADYSEGDRDRKRDIADNHHGSKPAGECGAPGVEARVVPTQ